MLYSQAKLGGRNPKHAANAKVSKPPETRSTLSDDFWTEVNKEIWTGHTAIKSIPNIMWVAAGVCDAQKKLLFNAL